MADREGTWKTRILGAASCLALGGALGLVLYCALRASPRMAEIPWMPLWLGKIADQFDTFRHFAGFAALATSTFFMPLMIGLQRSPSAKEAFRDWCLLALLLMVAGMETAQLAIPTRNFDWEDMYWGWAGVLSARFVLDTVRRVRRCWYARAAAARGSAGVLAPVRFNPAQ